MHKLCRFFLEHAGPTQNLGETSMLPFLVDMSRLFELFVARRLEENLEERYLLKAQDTYSVGESGGLSMNMDLVLFNRETHRPICVMDTKYKAHESVTPADYNQAVAYADRLGCENAFLIYPKDLVRSLDVKPGRIRVRGLAFDIEGDLDAGGKTLMKTLAL